MATIPKSVLTRFQTSVKKFQRVVQKASDRDINEADTVKIVSDMLCELFGYDEYTEITREYAIRNTYCDLAVKVGNDVKYLIEVKAISVNLNENHLRQAVGYGANEGIQWVILTNGVTWQVYSIRLKKTVSVEKIFEFNFLDLNVRKTEDQELLFLLAKEGLSKDVMGEYQERVKNVNPHVISAILLSSGGLTILRKELRKMTPGLRVEIEEIASILRNDLLKRNIIESEEFTDAVKRIKRSENKAAKKKANGDN